MIMLMLCQVGKIDESLLSLKYLFPIEERQLKSTALIKRETDNINNYDDNDGNSNKDNEKEEDDGREGGLAKKQRQETALLKEDSPTEE